MPRRRVRWDSGPAVFAISGGLFLLIGGVLSTVFCWGLPTDFAISQRTLEVTAQVERAELDTQMRINRKHPTRIAYRYVVDGRTYTDDVLTIDEQLVREASAPGTPLALEVDRAAPQRSRVVGTTRSLFGWLGAVTLLVPLVGLVQLAVAAVQMLKGRR